MQLCWLQDFNLSLSQVDCLFFGMQYARNVFARTRVCVCVVNQSNFHFIVVKAWKWAELVHFTSYCNLFERFFSGRLNFSENNCSSINLKCVCMHVRDQNGIFITFILIRWWWEIWSLLIYFLGSWTLLKHTYTTILPVEWFEEEVKVLELQQQQQKKKQQQTFTLFTETLNKHSTFGYNNICSTQIQNQKSSIAHITEFSILFFFLLFVQNVQAVHTKDHFYFIHIS